MLFELFLLVKSALAALGGLALISLIILYYDDIISWFQNRNELKSSDKDNVAFTLMDRINSGSYATVQGIFNSKTNTVLEARKIESEKVDDKLKDLHASNDLAIYL